MKNIHSLFLKIDHWLVEHDEALVTWFSVVIATGLTVWHIIGR